MALYRFVRDEDEFPMVEVDCYLMSKKGDTLLTCVHVLDLLGHSSKHPEAPRWERDQLFLQDRGECTSEHSS